MGSHFMLNIRNKHTREREKILAEGIKEVVAELRLVDVVDYVAFLRLDKFGNIADIVESSTQLYLKHGTLTFANYGQAHVNWNATPTIELEMRFSHQGVTVHFRLSLSAATASVHIVYITFEGGEAEPEVNTAELAAAMDAARLKPNA